eukprot:Gb_17410 [translate_table: standard]
MQMRHACKLAFWILSVTVSGEASQSINKGLDASNAEVGKTQKCSDGAGNAPKFCSNNVIPFPSVARGRNEPAPFFPIRHYQLLDKELLYYSVPSLID